MFDDFLHQLVAAFLRRAGFVLFCAITFGHRKSMLKNSEQSVIGMLTSLDQDQVPKFFLALEVEVEVLRNDIRQQRA